MKGKLNSVMTIKEHSDICKEKNYIVAEYAKNNNLAPKQIYDYRYRETKRQLKKESKPQNLFIRLQKKEFKDSGITLKIGNVIIELKNEFSESLLLKVVSLLDNK